MTERDARREPLAQHARPTRSRRGSTRASPSASTSDSRGAASSRWIIVISKNMKPEPERGEVHRRDALRRQRRPLLAHDDERQEQEDRGVERPRRRAAGSGPARRWRPRGRRLDRLEDLAEHLRELREVPEERGVVGDRVDLVVARGNDRVDLGGVARREPGDFVVRRTVSPGAYTASVSGDVGQAVGERRRPPPA